ERYGKRPKIQKAATTGRIKSKLENVQLNMIQRSMYRRLMYGLREYTPEQIAAMGPEFQSQIDRDHKKTKQVLHVMKSKRLYSVETRLINAMFQHINIGKRDHEWMLEIDKKHTLKSLGISTRDVINELINRKLLPVNFFNITPESALVL